MAGEENKNIDSNLEKIRKKLFRTSTLEELTKLVGPLTPEELNILASSDFGNLSPEDLAREEAELREKDPGFVKRVTERVLARIRQEEQDRKDAESFIDQLKEKWRKAGLPCAGWDGGEVRDRVVSNILEAIKTNRKEAT
jgi:hypothetical protein